MVEQLSPFHSLDFNNNNNTINNTPNNFGTYQSITSLDIEAANLLGSTSFIASTGSDTTPVVAVADDSFCWDRPASSNINQINTADTNKNKQEHNNSEKKIKSLAHKVSTTGSAKHRIHSSPTPTAAAAVDASSTMTPKKRNNKSTSIKVNKKNKKGMASRPSKPRRVIPENKEYIPDEKEGPRDVDVVSGRGGRSNHHAGNRPYWLQILKKREIYRSSRSDTEKTHIALTIIEFVEDTNGGRFLQLEDKTKRWFVLPRKVVLDKVKQALRDRYVPLWARDADEAAPGTDAKVQPITTTPQTSDGKVSSSCQQDFDIEDDVEEMDTTEENNEGRSQEESETQIDDDENNEEKEDGNDDDNDNDNDDEDDRKVEKVKNREEVQPLSSSSSSSSSSSLSFGPSGGGTTLPPAVLPLHPNLNATSVTSTMSFGPSLLSFLGTGSSGSTGSMNNPSPASLPINTHQHGSSTSQEYYPSLLPPALDPRQEIYNSMSFQYPASLSFPFASYPSTSPQPHDLQQQQGQQQPPTQQPNAATTSITANGGAAPAVAAVATSNSGSWDYMLLNPYATASRPSPPKSSTTLLLPSSLTTSLSAPSPALPPFATFATGTSLSVGGGIDGVNAPLPPLVVTPVQQQQQQQQQQLQTLQLQDQRRPFSSSLSLSADGIDALFETLHQKKKQSADGVELGPTNTATDVAADQANAVANQSAEKSKTDWNSMFAGAFSSSAAGAADAQTQAPAKSQP